MLTRLKIQGFKNLVDVELHFGALTCLAGPNNVGKSNLLDVLCFLGQLADKTLVEAAVSVRGGRDSAEALFTRDGDRRLLIEVDLLLPRLGTDDFGQAIVAGDTPVRYHLVLGLTEDERLVLVEEDLRVNRAVPAFPHAPAFKESVWVRTKRDAAFISTNAQGMVLLRADRSSDGARRGGGKPQPFDALRLPRTVLSSAVNGEEHRTAALVRQAMRGWRQLQMEPSALRRPDEWHDPSQIDATGAHVAATLHRLANASLGDVEARVANRLAMLIDGVDEVRVHRDEVRRLLRFALRDRSGREFFSDALSDGTLRFVALAVLEQDSVGGLLLLEEPENGIHPQRIRAMVDLLEALAVDVQEPVGEDNPLRQVIFTTHSPVVAAEVQADDLVFVGNRFNRDVTLQCFEGSWRAGSPVDMPTTSVGAVRAFLAGRPAREGQRRARVRDIVQLELFREAG